MSLWQACREWEHNGYHDSDFYVVVFNDETNKLQRVEVGTTRFAGCVAHHSQICYVCRNVRTDPMPESVRKRMKEELYSLWKETLIATAKRRIENPTGELGSKVILTKDVRNRPRDIEKVDCWKCYGSGKWINPRNAEDKRDCFACNGSGKKDKSVPVKGKMIKIPKGTTGEVSHSWEGFNNKRVIIKKDDGSTFSADIKNLNLIEEIDYSKIDNQAKFLSERKEIYPLFATSPTSLV